MDQDGSSVKTRDEGLERCGWLAYVVGRVLFRLLGWRIVGELPPLNKAVLVVAPHTSNWDFIVGLTGAWRCRLKFRWLGKHTLFRPPFGWLFRALGGLPVDRTAAQGLVAQLVTTFGERERLALVVPPSGTRKAGEYWKSGFYHIALGAGVPIVCVRADYARKEAKIGPPVYLEGNVSADMDRIREFFDGVTGKIPEWMTRIRLRDEDAPEQADQARRGG